MATPANPNEALGQRLLTDEGLKEKLGIRMTPNKPRKNDGGGSTKPYLVFFKIGGGGNGDLGGKSGLQGHAYRLLAYATTDKEAEEILALVSDRLAGNRRKGVEPWIDKANGVHACLPADDADADTDDDGDQYSGQTYTLWFCPQ